MAEDPRRETPLSLYLSLLALFLGVAFHLQAVGRDFTVSWIDLAAIAIGVAGSVEAWRRREIRFDVAIVGYVALVVVVLIQALILPDPWAIAGGSSRFVTAGLVLFGLSQLAPGRDGAATKWSFAFVVFGLALAGWTLVQLGRGLASAEAETFYEVKNTIALPIGASNYLAAFLLVTALIAVVYAVLRHDWTVPAAIIVLGLIATLSRGAMLAFGLALLLGAWLAQSWRLVLVTGAAALVAAGVFLGVASGAATLVDRPSIEVAAAPSGDDEPPEPAPPPRAHAAPDPNANGRMVLYEAAWEAFLADPWLGVGLNRLETVTARTGPPHDNAHNLGLHALASVGIVGTVPYLAVWLVLAWRLRRLPSSHERTALAVAFGGLFVHAQIEALSFTRAVEVVVAILLVLAGSHAGAFGVRTVPLGREQVAAG